MNKRRENGEPNCTDHSFRTARLKVSLYIGRALLGAGILVTSISSQSAYSAEKKLIRVQPSIDISSSEMLDDRVLTKTYRDAKLVAVSSPGEFSGDVRDLPAAPEWRPGDAVKVANPRYISNQVNRLPAVNPVIKNHSKFITKIQTNQRQVADLEIGVNITGFEFNGVNPPDPSGEVGENYYIHAINSSDGSQVSIIDKTNGNKVGDAFTLSSLSSSGDCSKGLGDPVVIYDEYAKRWLLTEFADGSNKLCVYLSKTADPVSGGWHAYEFTAPEFPDYPKYSVWGGNYYVSANESGGAVYALERLKMLNGEPAAMVRQTIPSLAGFGFQSISPVDADGENPPVVGTPGIFIRHRDDELHHSGSNDGDKDFIEIWTFSPDFANPDSSVLVGPVNIEVSELDSDFTCPDNFGCLEQKPETGQTLSTLDPLKEVVYYKPQYRNFKTHESITGSFATKLDGNKAGFRWFELRKVAGDWALHQEGMAPSTDNNSRYMGGVAQDGDGNIAAAYMITGADEYPGIRLTGRRAGDALGTIAGEEISIVAADGAIATERNGDYSHMSVDPIDHCTFWFTAEHGSTGAMWKTGISSFKFPGCTGVGSTDPVFSISATDLSQEVCRSGDLGPIDVTITGYNNFDKNVDLTYVDLASGLTGVFSANPLSSGTMSQATVSVESGTAAGDYLFKIKGSSAGFDDELVSASVKVVESEQTATLSEPNDGAEKVDNGTEFAWTTDGYVKSYTVEIATDVDFSNVITIGSVSGGTRYRPSQSLPQLTKLFWRVKAVNSCGLTTSSTFSFTTGSDKDKAEQLMPNEAKAIEGAEGDSTHYYIDMPAGVSALTVEISGGEGDVDLFVGFGKIAQSADDLVCRSDVVGNEESCEITDVKEGTYFITTNAYEAFSNAELIAKYEVPNIAPVALEDTFTILKGSSNNLLDVLANDTDADNGDTLSIDSIDYSGSSAVSISQGKIAYTPSVNVAAEESFGYVLMDNRGGTAQGMVKVLINTAPAAVNDSFTVKQDSTGHSFDVLANDTDLDSGDMLSLVSISYTGSGSAMISAGKIAYTPQSGFSGEENIGYVVGDGKGGNAQGSAKVTIEKKSSGGGSLDWMILLILSLPLAKSSIKIKNRA